MLAIYTKKSVLSILKKILKIHNSAMLIQVFKKIYSGIHDGNRRGLRALLCFALLCCVTLPHSFQAVCPTPSTGCITVGVDDNALVYINGNSGVVSPADDCSAHPA